jgi:hypothetical protein
MHINASQQSEHWTLGYGATPAASISRTRASSFFCSQAESMPAPDAGIVVAVDVGLIVVDSILYGIMFARRNNLWVVWLAHLLGDILGLPVIMSI